MQDERVISTPLIAWGVASRPSPGEVASGDLHLIQPTMDGVLLAVVDGLGHGEAAIAAAQAAIAILKSHAEESLISLVDRCHAALRKTRGAVMTVATLRSLDGQLTWLGVGNVEAILLRADRQAKPSSDRVLLRSGLVGYQLPVLRVTTLALAPDDLLIFATDGILERHFKGHDDALVLVVRYLGPQHE